MASRRSVRRWLLPPVAVLIGLAAAFAAHRLAGSSWEQVVSYRSPFTATDLPAAGSGPPVAGRLVLVIVDGLGEEASREMNSLERLRDIGADLTLVAGQPSLSYPTWTTLLSGAPPNVSGVTTDRFEERVPVETLLDTALRSGRTVGVVGPTSFETLYGAGRAQAAFLMDREGDYLSARLVDEALRIDGGLRPDLLVVHLPDVDEAGRASGTGSSEYAEVVRRVDGDLARLVEGTQDARTAYAVVSAHGHVAGGGYGGWEPEVLRAPAVLSGDGFRYARMTARQSDLAPTLAALTGIPSPRQAAGEALAEVLATTSGDPVRPTWAQRRAFAAAYADVVLEPTGVTRHADWGEDSHGEALDSWIRSAERVREAHDRWERVPAGIAVAAGAVLALAAVGLASWRALLAALAGTAVYHALYNAAYFLVHGHWWSLSAFNSRSDVRSFFSLRMAEAAAAGLAAAFVAGLVYAALRRAPRGSRGRFLPGWLALGPVTALTAQATLALQVAWFLWWYGASVTWRMPDLRWALKYELDLVQATALGAAAVLSPLVTWLAGRYHPRVRRAEETRRAAEDAERGRSVLGEEQEPVVRRKSHPA
ncbi:MAG: alkaline phosphatase family protein [Coriobacteriia bacterium]|nr:alkaline phosphatase family protein [Coriobacteriia bacterium]